MIKKLVLEMGERPIQKNQPNSFKKTSKQRLTLKAYKAQNKKERKEEFGADYKKHLNTSKKSIETIKIYT